MYRIESTLTIAGKFGISAIMGMVRILDGRVEFETISISR